MVTPSPLALIVTLLTLLLTTHSSSSSSSVVSPPSLPPILLYSLHMRPVTSHYFALTLESMRRNAQVDFLIINIVDEDR
jgi:hypothetical protein